MEKPKPLHVQVAEALGWTNVHYAGNFMVPDSDLWMGKPPGCMIVGPSGEEGVPRYDIHWDCGGPLIEKYNINLSANYVGRGVLPGPWWEAVVYFKHAPFVRVEEQPTPLLAVCHWVLAAKAAGHKLSP